MLRPRLSTVVTGLVWLVVVGLAANLVGAVRWSAGEPFVVPNPGGAPQPLSEFLPSPRLTREVTVLEPTVVVLQETLYGPRTPGDPASRQTFVIRADGSRAHRFEFLQLQSRKRVAQRTISFSDGRKVVLDELRQLKYSTAVPGQGAPTTLRDPASNCTQTRAGVAASKSESHLIGVEDVAGTRAVRIKAGNIEDWFALDHNCMLVRSVRDLGRGNYARLEVVQLVAARPVDSWFEVPVSFREVRPSEFHRLNPASGKGKQLDELYQTYKLVEGVTKDGDR